MDGPAAAGKSTLARMAAETFGLVYVDTGALYRAVGLHVRERNVLPDDQTAVVAMMPALAVDLKYDADGLQRVILCGRDVTADIRTPEMSRYASAVSAIPAVRAFLLEAQRDMARKYDVIMDGRDIGTVVLPNAGLKVFVTADIASRAKRRCAELAEKGIGSAYEEVEAEMRERDKNDTLRAAAPLKAADDAVILDTTALDLEQSHEALCALIRGRFFT